jgi:hypothetical protein
LTSNHSPSSVAPISKKDYHHHTFFPCPVLLVCNLVSKSKLFYEARWLALCSTLHFLGLGLARVEHVTPSQKFLSILFTQILVVVAMSYFASSKRFGWLVQLRGALRGVHMYLTSTVWMSRRLMLQNEFQVQTAYVLGLFKFDLFKDCSVWRCGDHLKMYPWILRQASCWYVIWWMPSAKDSLASCWNHSTMQPWHVSVNFMSPMPCIKVNLSSCINQQNAHLQSCSAICVFYCMHLHVSVTPVIIFRVLTV